MKSDEWTIGQGLQRAFIHLLLWGALCAIGWAALQWLATPLLNSIPRGRAVFWLHGLAAFLPALAVGHLLFARMVEKAGFNSMILSALAVIFIWASIISGSLIADAIRPLTDSREWILIMSGGLIATVEVIYETLADR